MNAKQTKIHKKIGEHIAALHSLYDEFQKADDSFDNPSARIQAVNAKIAEMRKSKTFKEATARIYGDKK